MSILWGVIPCTVHEPGGGGHLYLKTHYDWARQDGWAEFHFLVWEIQALSENHRKTRCLLLCGTWTNDSVWMHHMPPGALGGTQVGLLCNSCFLQSLNLNQFCLVKHTNQCPILIILSCSGYCGSFMAAFMGLSSAVFTYITRVQETVKRVMWGRSYTRPVRTHAA